MAFGCSTDLELCEVDEDLLEVGPRQRKVLDDLVFKHLGEVAESRAEHDFASHDVDAFNAVPNLNMRLRDLNHRD